MSEHNTVHRHDLLTHCALSARSRWSFISRGSAQREQSSQDNSMSPNPKCQWRLYTVCNALFFLFFYLAPINMHITQKQNNKLGFNQCNNNLMCRPNLLPAAPLITNVPSKNRVQIRINTISRIRSCCDVLVLCAFWHSGIKISRCIFPGRIASHACVV